MGQREEGDSPFPHPVLLASSPAISGPSSHPSPAGTHLDVPGMSFSGIRGKAGVPVWV